MCVKKKVNVGESGRRIIRKEKQDKSARRKAVGREKGGV